MAYIFTGEDKSQLRKKGISEEKIAEQLHYFIEGFPTLNIKKPASVNEGILKLDADRKRFFVQWWDKYFLSASSFRIL